MFERHHPLWGCMTLVIAELIFLHKTKKYLRARKKLFQMYPSKTQFTGLGNHIFDHQNNFTTPNLNLPKNRGMTYPHFAQQKPYLGKRSSVRALTSLGVIWYIQFKISTSDYWKRGTYSASLNLLNVQINHKRRYFYAQSKEPLWCILDILLCV